MERWEVLMMRKKNKVYLTLNADEKRLLMDGFIDLYVKAAEEWRLKVYEKGKVVPENNLEPTCISDNDMEELREPLCK